MDTRHKGKAKRFTAAVATADYWQKLGPYIRAIPRRPRMNATFPIVGVDRRPIFPSYADPEIVNASPRIRKPRRCVVIRSAINRTMRRLTVGADILASPSFCGVLIKRPK